MKIITSSSADGRVTGAWRVAVVCTLIVLVGMSLRSAILGVPPILPLIKRDLNLSYTATGLLTAIPTLIMGAMAWFSGLVAERIGGRATVIIGLILLAAGTLLRAVWPAAFLLFFFTIVLSVGIALTQTTIPVLIRRWFPMHIGLTSALFTDGLIIGETLGAGATVPLMLLYFGKDAWAATFILWGLPIIVLLAFWLWLAPSAPPQVFKRSERSGEAREKENAPPRQQVRTIHLGLLLGSASLIYFGMNAWIAPYNSAIHRPDLTPLALTILNAAQLPTSIGVTFFAQPLMGRRWPFISAGIVCSLAMLGWLFGPPSLEYISSAMFGASSALVFTLGLALPPLLASPGRVARLTGATLTISYSATFIGPFLGGGLWDLFRVPELAFLPVALASILLIALGAMLPEYG